MQRSLTRLRDPGALRWSSAPPVNGWDGCALVATVLGRSFTYSPFGFKDPFSGCLTSSPAGSAAKRCG